ncbi:MAG: hypothetical protein AVDCRST_MAG90-2869 [uncultured Microvirga sp.]|uniref:Uncharacterized protein n=1 Tax=uncultured Microvirga sp. TaxID=412392 RepID=A0A6J4MJF6_9HYPH|nr:MAG: hypothetical protein AVDCRST_MAG90-2869 [uncultured Microvirga sp.]
MRPDREQEARDALERVRRDSETIGGSSLARATRKLGAHFAGQDAEGDRSGETDPVEVWGRRIGRALSLLGVVGLTYWLGVQLRWW